jgi:hypothetical protein
MLYVELFWLIVQCFGLVCNVMSIEYASKGYDRIVFKIAISYSQEGYIYLQNNQNNVSRQIKV